MITQTDKIVQDRDLYRFMPSYDEPVYGTSGAQNHKLQSFKITVPEEPPGGNLQIVVYAVKTPEYFGGPPHTDIDPETGNTVEVPGQHIIRVISITPKTPTVVSINLAPPFKYVYVRTRIPGNSETPGCPIGPADNTPPPVIPIP